MKQPVSGGVFVPNYSVIAPIADQLTNTANATLTYQFAANGMLGASGTFTNLHYSNQSQVPGLSDSSSKGGSAFYSHRLSKMHYIGVTYQYQMFLAYPTLGQSETQTHSVFGFYTVYLKPTLSISMFGGPQYSNTQPFGMPTSSQWSPGGGASMAWQGKLTSLAASYSRTINDAGGLSRSGAGEYRQRLAASAIDANPERINWGKLCEQQCSGRIAHVKHQRAYHLGKRLGAAPGRPASEPAAAIHASAPELQRYCSDIPPPDRNLVTATISYQFTRPLGR